MSSEAKTTPLDTDDLKGAVTDLDRALLKMALLVGDGAPEGMFEPMRAVATVRGMLNDAIEGTEGEADHG